MQSRKDHLQAYQFATGRLASALVSGDAGTGDPPMRRSGTGAVFGVFIALLLVLASVVYGVMKPLANTAWTRPGSMIVEKETGTRYLYFDGHLRPTANYASALLAVGSGATMRTVSRNDMAGVPHGSAIGIPGAPDVVPQPTGLLWGSWTYCLHPDSATDHVLDFDPQNTRPIPAAERILLTGPDHDQYVLWQGTKYPVSGRPALIALGLDTRKPVTAPGPWLSALPNGATIAPAAITGAGSAGRAVAGGSKNIGQLFESTVGGVSHFYVLEADGIAAVTATEAALLATAHGEQPQLVSPADIAAVQASADETLLHRLPDLLAAGDPGDSGAAALCLLQTMDGTQLRSSVVRETGPAATGGSAVLIPPGKGVYATGPQTGSNPSNVDRYLITEQGTKFLIADDQAAQALGYGNATPRPLPQYLLDMLSTGPRLSREQAATAVPGA